VRIAIVGAGIAGLANAKVLREAGHDVDVFDRTPDVGGVWSATRRYPGLRTQNSKRIYCFSQLPTPASYPRVPSGAQMQNYLQSYVDYFGFGDRIHLNTEVIVAQPDRRGWALQVRNLEHDRSETVGCDHLVVSNGVFSSPMVPRYPGADAFGAAGGQLCHTSDFLDVREARDKHVVVVGYGKSACDVATAVSDVAASTTVLARRLLWKIPRRVRWLGDFETLGLTRFGEAGFDYLEPNWFERFYNGRGRRLRDAAFDLIQALVTRQLRLRELGLVPDGPFEDIAQSTASLVTEGFYEKVASGQIAMHRDTEITRLLDGPAIELSTGTRARADIVLCATGFRQHVPFLDQVVQRQLTDDNGNFRLYRQILPSTVKAVTFAGYNSSMLSALGAEIGALWTAGLLAGRLDLPTAAERDAHIDSRLAWLHQRTGGHHAHGTVIAGFNIHNIDEMLADLGVNVRPLTRASQWVLPINPQSYRTITARLNRRSIAPSS
jgi:cation diffusion facilitator CzcD-associated flavoprotein CzcO